MPLLKSLESLQNELGIKQNRISYIWPDNMGVTYISANPVFHEEQNILKLIFVLDMKELWKRSWTYGSFLPKNKLRMVSLKPWRSSHLKSSRGILI